MDFRSNSCHVTAYTYPSPVIVLQRTLLVNDSTNQHHKCNQFLRHKTVMFSPSKLREVGIEVLTCVQAAGEIVITFPGAYHAGFNHGFNIAESCNFATPRWFPIGGAAKRCVCRPHSVNINVLVLETAFLRRERQTRKDAGIVTQPSRRFRCSCGVNEVPAAPQELSFECSACGAWGHASCCADDGVERRCYICLDIDACAAACTSTAPVLVEESRKKRKTDDPLIFVGDKVQMIASPESGSDVIMGTVTDIEDDLGRLHVKNTRKDNDLWFPLAECVLVERGRSSKFLRECFSTPVAQAKGLAESMTPAKKAKKEPKGVASSHGKGGQILSASPPPSSSSSSSSSPSSSLSSPPSSSSTSTAGLKTSVSSEESMKVSDDVRPDGLIVGVREDTVLLPDDLIEIHEQPLCAMLEKMSPDEVTQWIARVVLPLWTTTGTATEPQQGPHVEEEESEAFLLDLDPYLRTGKNVVVRHVILRILAAAVRRKVLLPLFLFK